MLANSELLSGMVRDPPPPPGSCTYELPIPHRYRTSRPNGPQDSCRLRWLVSSVLDTSVRFLVGPGGLATRDSEAWPSSPVVMSVA